MWTQHRHHRVSVCFRFSATPTICWNRMQVGVEDPLPRDRPSRRDLPWRESPGFLPPESPPGIRSESPRNPFMTLESDFPRDDLVI